MDKTIVNTTCQLLAENLMYEKIEWYLTMVMNKKGFSIVKLNETFQAYQRNRNIQEYQKLLDFLKLNDYDFKGVEFDGLTDLLIDEKQLSFAIEI